MRSATKRKLGKDRTYLEFLHEQPCAVAAVDILFTRCSGRITAHHAGPRGISQRCPDRQAVPLCFAHHQDGPHSAHRLGKNFWQFHGIDCAELILKLNRQFEGSLSYA